MVDAIFRASSGLISTVTAASSGSRDFHPFYFGIRSLIGCVIARFVLFPVLISVPTSTLRFRSVLRVNRLEANFCIRASEQRFSRGKAILPLSPYRVSQKKARSVFFLYFCRYDYITRKGNGSRKTIYSGIVKKKIISAERRFYRDISDKCPLVKCRSVYTNN